MLTENQLNVKHNIYWFEDEQMYRRIIGGVSEFGYRTNDIFGDNIYVNPVFHKPKLVFLPILLV
jgi:hypothetical protein